LLSGPRADVIVTGRRRGPFATLAGQTGATVVDARPPIYGRLWLAADIGAIGCWRARAQEAGGSRRIGEVDFVMALM
jgi:hypothetical protein